MAVSMPVDLTGNQSKAVISIFIVDDTLAEGYETFGGKLEVMSQSLNLSFVSNITIEIIDNEGTLACFITMNDHNIYGCDNVLYNFS